MKNILLSLMVFGIVGVVANDEDSLYKAPLNLKGEMSCKVKDSVLLAVEDGKSQRYTGEKNSFNVGDTLFLNYEYTEYFYKPSYVMKFQLVDKARDGTYISVSEMSSIEATLGNLNFSEDTIFIKSMFDIRLSLRRYYKNDWEGIYTAEVVGDFYVWTVALDCRNQENKIEEIIKAYEKRPKEK